MNQLRREKKLAENVIFSSKSHQKTVTTASKLFYSVKYSLLNDAETLKKAAFGRTKPIIHPQKMATSGKNRQKSSFKPRICDNCKKQEKPMQQQAVWKFEEQIGQ